MAHYLEYLDESEPDLAPPPVEVSSQIDADWSFHSLQYEAWASTARNKVIVAGRRGGKSELGSRWMLAGAMQDNLSGVGGVSWVVLPTFQMARPLWRKFLRLAPPGWITHTVGSDNSPNAIQIGNARIEFQSGDHPERLVGEGLRRVLCDEAGILKARVWQESIQPALLDYGAPAMLIGTPKGKNWFHAMYMRGLGGGDDQVKTFSWPTTANPFIKTEEVERLRLEMTERLFRQEILAQFLDDDGAVFRGHRNLIGPYSTNPTVCYGVDLARKMDYTVVTGMDRNRRITFWERWRNVPWPEQERRLIEISKASRNAGSRPKFVVDGTGVGDPVVQNLMKAGLRVESFVFTPQSKTQLIDALALAIEKAEIGLVDEPILLSELDVFEFEQTKGGYIRYAAPEGMNDDTVCSLALCLKAAWRSGDTGVTIGESEQPAVKTPMSPNVQHPESLVENETWSDPDNWS